MPSSVQPAPARGLHYINTELVDGVLSTGLRLSNGHVPDGVPGPLSYSQLALVSYQGTIIAFARGHTDAGVRRHRAVSDKLVPSNLYFTVLAPDPNDQNGAMAWTGFQPVAFPNAVRPAGMQIISIPVIYGGAAELSGLQDAGLPIRAKATADYLYILRQAVEGSLLVNRFRLVRKAGTATSGIEYVLEPAWEVRFQRSGKPDTPADAKDVLNYISADGEPFLEPTLELFMLRGQTEADFDVEFLPVQGGGTACQIFEVDHSRDEVALYNVPLDANGLFMLGDKEFDNQHHIPPDAVFKLVDESQNGVKLVGAPSAAYYQKQERVRDASSATYLVKRTGRLTLAIRGTLTRPHTPQNGQPPASDPNSTLATIDFSVAADGTLATPTPVLRAAPVGPANYAMEFGALAWMRFTDIVFGNKFAVGFWIYPKSKDPSNQLIVCNGGGTSGTPYVSLREGTRIEAGFTGKNGKPLTCVTAAGLVPQQTWSHVVVTFDGTATPRFQVRVNGSLATTTITGDGDTPPDSPVNQVSIANSGFVGDLDDLRIYTGAPVKENLIAEWGFDDINYADNPPTTPNSATPANPGQIYGAYLVPSTNPAFEDNSGSLTFDSRNLTIYTAYFKDFSQYAELHSSPYVLAGSDGLLHCYFQGKDNRFSVLQFNTETARAVFAAPWQTMAGPDESGTVQFVASQSGAFMNTATVTTKPPSDAALSRFFCDVELKSPSGRVETWQGVPRSLLPFTNVLNGQFKFDPADPQLANGAKVFFDVDGTHQAAYIPLNLNSSGGQMAFVTRYPNQFPLSSVTINELLTETATVTLEFATPRWSQTRMTQVWRRVSPNVQKLLATLDGVDPDFAYTDGAYCNANAYGLVATSNDASSNRVLVWTNPSVTPFEVTVSDGSGPLVCEVTIRLTSGGRSLSATWRDVPRQQVAFARTLEHDNSKYDYTRHASGDYAAIGALLIVTSNGMNAAVTNSHVTAPANMLAGASIFGAFATAAVAASEKIDAPIGPVTATSFQRAFYEQHGTRTFLSNGSMLFASLPASVPNQGGVGFVKDTTNLQSGSAGLVQQGVNGGWIDNPAQRCLAFSANNYVSFSVDSSNAPNIDELTIPGDLSLEMWCQPRRVGTSGRSPNQRLLTFNRNAIPSDATTAVRYMAGLRDCPSLSFTKNNNTVRAAAATGEGTFYTWFSVDTLTAGVIGSIATTGLSEPVLAVSLNANQKLQVACPMDTKTGPISSTANIVAGTWNQVAVTFLSTETNDGYSVAASLYVNGEHQGDATYSIKLPRLTLATFALGDIATNNTLPMYLNETALFVVRLSPDQIRQFSEQRIPDNFPKMMFKWMFIDSSAGNIAVNSSASGTKFSPSILPSATWADKGLYFRPVLGYDTNIATLIDKPIIQGWNHLALVHQAGYALKLNGTQYADCGNGDSLQLGRQFALEAWFQLDRTAVYPSQTILAKGANYLLWITNDWKPALTVQIATEAGSQPITLTSKTAITDSAAHYFAVNYEVVQITVKNPNNEQRTQEYELHIDLYVDNVVVARGVMESDTSTVYKRFKDSPDLVTSTAHLNLGRTPEFGGAGYFHGYLSDIRLWSRTLTAAEMTGVYTSHRPPTTRDGLISYWRFNDGTGKTAFDAQGNNDAKLSDGGLMVNFKPTAANWFLVNGESSSMTQYADSTSSVGGYGSEQFNLGYVAASNPIGFSGQLDEVRIWDTQLTQEQINDSMNRSLSGSEPGLMGLWGFENGSGATLLDNTGRGNTGTLRAGSGSLPTWLESTAPLNDESSVVYNVLGGVPTFELRTIDERPTVIDYADVERDAYGSIFSVMKRAYLFVDSGQAQLTTGYKVGDLDTVYIGQVQTKPTIVGFIEGGPPIPSENQTKPFWKGTLSEYNSYDDAGSVEFEEASETKYVFSADRDYSESDEFGMKGGLYVSGQFGTAEGIGFEVTERDVAFEGHLGAQNKIVSETHSKPGGENSFGTSRSVQIGMEPGGSWEPGTQPSMWLNPVVGRRYIPSNVGCAIVKSLTADLYASKLRSTGMMVKLTVIPNPSIPVDVNIITFPINPHYVKNGSLDGNVGLVPDPDVDPRVRSYFQPVGAYALKREIERQEKQLEAYYLQFNADHYASQLIGKSAWDAYQNTVTDTPAYDWAKFLSKRNIVNTYVWTAAGGLYAEQVSTMNVHTETYNAVASTSAGLGLAFDLATSVPVAGPYVEIDYIHNWKAEVSVVRSKEQSREFTLTATASPDVFLTSPVFENGHIEFPETPTEGKVDAYRYMAFFLAPTSDNYDELKAQVVDALWLEQSMDQAAVALREATVADNGAWRILFRVTYVSRIPPTFQPAPAQTTAPDVQKPVNLPANSLIMALVKKEIQSQTPTPLEIGTAVMTVLGTPINPGVLNSVLPWWAAFLNDSTNYVLPAAGILGALREDLLQYVTADYAAANHS